MGEPAWSETLHRIRSGHRTMVKQMHPDAQLTVEGDLLPLEGTDVTDQESAMKLVWQCVRSGQTAQAQLAAKDQGLFWLAASMMGVADEFHELSALAQPADCAARVVSVRHGNTKKSNWMNTCFDHSQRVFESYQRRSASRGSHAVVDSRDDRGLHSAVLEASVFGALSNNAVVLASSPLMSEWPDLLWVAVKTHHDRRMHRVLHGHRLRRARLSTLFPGCAPDELAAEEKYIQRLSKQQGNVPLPRAGSSQAHVLSAAFCVSVLDMLRHLRPCPAAQSDSGCLAVDASFTLVSLWRLQAAFIGGLATLKEHVAEMMEYFETETVAVRGKEVRKYGRSSGHNRLLRVYTHVYIWLKAAPVSHQDVRAIVSDDRADCLHTVAQHYVNMLMHHKNRSLVALYCVFLPRAERVHSYVRLMQSLPASTRRIGESGSTVISDAPAMEATEVLNAAAVYFRGDLGDITRAVVDTARVIGFDTPDESRGRRRNAAEYEAEDDEDARSILSSRDVTDVSDILNSTTKSKKVRYETEPNRSMTMSTVPDSFGGNKGSVSFSANQSFTGSMTRLKASGQNEVAVAVDDADVSRMDTLRWLCIDVQDRPEAVRQANAFIRQLLLESKGSKTNELRLLLGKILPQDTLAVAKDVYSREVISQSSLDDLSWGADYSQLKFWYLIGDAFAAIEAWDVVQREFQGASKSMLGGNSVLQNSLSRFKPKISAACENAVLAISGAIRCSADSYEELFDCGDGVRSVWSSGEKALKQQFCDLIEEILLRMESGELVDAIPLDTALVISLQKQATSLFCLERSHSHSKDAILKDIKIGLLDILDVVAIEDAVNRLCSACGSECIDVSPSTNAALEECIRILVDIGQRRCVMSLIVGILMRQWSKVIDT